MKSSTSQTPNAPYSAIRTPHRSEAEFTEGNSILPLSPRLPVALSVAVKIDNPGSIRALPTSIAYDSSLYLFAAGFFNAFFTMPVLAFAGTIRHWQNSVHEVGAGFARWKFGIDYSKL
jgi:hypothetical protein